MANRASGTIEGMTPLTKKDAPSNQPTGEQAANTPPPGEPTAPSVADPAGYHDSVSGKPVDVDGRFLDQADGDPVPKHRVVANEWPSLRD